MFVGAGSREHQMRVAIDQAGRDPRAVQCVDLARAIARELGPLARPHDLAVGNPDRAILDNPQRIAGRFLERRDVAVDEQPVPHAVALGERRC